MAKVAALAVYVKYREIFVLRAMLKVSWRWNDHIWFLNTFRRAGKVLHLRLSWAFSFRVCGSLVTWWACASWSPCNDDGPSTLLACLTSTTGLDSEHLTNTQSRVDSYVETWYSVENCFMLNVPSLPPTFSPWRPSQAPEATGLKSATFVQQQMYAIDLSQLAVWDPGTLSPIRLCLQKMSVHLRKCSVKP